MTERAPATASARWLMAAGCILFACCAALHETQPLRLRVMAYNIKHGRGMDGAIDLARIAAVIRAANPDVVTLQEVDNGCGRSGVVDQARVLAELCSMRHAFGPIRPYDGGLYGMAVLSRHPIVSAPDFVPKPGDDPRCTIEARIRPPQSATDVIVTGIHLYRTEEERLAQARSLVRRYADTEVPVLLAGDFNSERGSRVMNLLEQHWANPVKNGDINTFPADAPVKEIDFVLVRASAGHTVRESLVVPESMASDHRPILLDVELLPPAVNAR